MTSLAELGGWPAVLASLTANQDLTAPVAAAAMGEILAGDATSAQIAAFIVGLRSKGETVEELSGLLATMLDFAERVELPRGVDVVDTCGTGGDGSNSINVSTVAALVVAGAGAVVCKHGNRAASSMCGSADVLEALGVAIELGPAQVAACVDQAGFGFCFAPRFHAALRHAAPTRREIGVRTVFNFLGPLANPARARRQVLGCSDPAMAEKLVRVLQANGATRALVVYGHDGLDELTTTTTSTVLDLRDGEITSSVVDPAALGLAVSDGVALRGGDAATNADCARSILDGKPGAHRDIVVLNAAAGLVAAGKAADITEGLELAMAAIDDGRAAASLDLLVTTSRRLAAATGV